ncbi:MAG: hypothetical protein AUK32_06555 [Candidatus Aquicultor secundus]|nr:response regulator transcription factor [Candidatus Aquicultor secundus]OIO85856.1 MAG: hypothetical protein AUK32_06555 [Candidatus Aquicultor secundus]
MKEPCKKKAFLFLLLYRWLTLTNVVILNLTGAKRIALLPFALVLIYNVALSSFPGQVYEKVRKVPLLLSIDLIFHALILFISGGWASPFFLCGLSPLLTSALLFKFKGAIYSATAYSMLYLLELSGNRFSIAKFVQMKQLDSFISDFVSFFLVAIFFAYPSHLLDQLEESKQEAGLVKQDLEQAYKRLDLAYQLVPLSKREMDVLRLISEGKSNKEIAEALFLSKSTIKTHVSSILKKLNLKSRSEAVAYFYKEENASLN